MYIQYTSKFRPYSYDELVKPLIQYKAAWDAANADFSSLAAQTEAWKNIVEQDQNSKAYSMFKEYSDNLNAVVDSFMKGMSINNVSKGLGLKKGYASNIVPIQNAYNTRLKHIEEQNKGKAAGLVYATDAALTSLDDYIDNPSLQHDFADSSAGYKRVATAAAALSKRLASATTGRLDAYTKTFLQEHGYRDNEIAQAIYDIQSALQGNGNIRGNGILQGILANEMQTSGVSSWKDKSKQLDYLNRVAPALYNAVGQTNISTFEDYGSKLAAQTAAKAASNTPSVTRPYREQPKTNVSGKGSTSDMKKDGDFIVSLIQDPSKINGVTTSTTYIPGVVSPTTGVMGSVGGGSYGTIEKKNTDRLAELSKKYNIDIKWDLVDGKISNHNLYEVLNAINNEIKSSAVRSNTYILDITDPSLVGKTIRENVVSSNRRGYTGLYALDGDKKGKQVKFDKVSPYLTDDIQLEFDPDLKSFVLYGTSSEGKVESFVVDPEILTPTTLSITDNEGNPKRVNQYQHAINTISEALKGGDSDYATDIIDMMMLDVYNRFNSIAKVQGKTLGSKEQ